MQVLQNAIDSATHQNTQMGSTMFSIQGTSYLRPTIAT